LEECLLLFPDLLGDIIVALIKLFDFPFQLEHFLLILFVFLSQLFVLLPSGKDELFVLGDFDFLFFAKGLQLVDLLF
jgi:hypothetical protein